MLFNRHGLQQKNWRMVKKGKHILFGCSLFFVVGGTGIAGSQVVHASEINSSEVIAKEGVVNNTTGEKPRDNTSALEKEKSVEGSNDKKIEKTIQNQGVEKSESNESTKNPLKKEVNKKELKDLIDKIKKTDISKKTEKSVKELNLILSRAEKTLDNKEITQEEIEKEIKDLKEAFEKLEDKPEKEKVSESKEKDESKKEEKSDLRKENLEKIQEGNKEDFARKHNEKITKVTETVTEIQSIANQINYEFSDAEKELVKTAEKLPTFYNSGTYNEEDIQKLLKEVIYLRNKVANRMTRAHSGRRDSRNGKMINGKDESRFRAIWISPTANKYEGSSTLVNDNKKELTFYNSDTLFSVMTAYGKRGNGEPLVRYPNGPKRGEEDPTPYYVKRVGIISGLNQVKGLKLRVAYKNFQTGKKEEVDITEQYWNVNNPEVQMAFVGTIGDGGNVTPGTYHITIGANGTHKQNTITYTLTIKAQSERNTVNNLTPTYVDDVRHLTETEKNALIEKFKTEHPNVVNRANHIDFDRAEVSADGATMTIHFKDGFAPKTIQTNAQNDAIAKYQNLTALYGDPHDFYKNPRNLVKSKTGNELPSTVDVQWKTPFNLQQPGTRNAVVTVTYQNGTVKDVSTPYTVLDFVGKQDKRINQHQSGELGDARSYITLSNGTAPSTDLTIRWKGGSSTVDTSRPMIHRKQIEILRGNTVMKTVDIPVEIVDNIRPTVEIPYDNPGNQEIYLYSHENNNITLKAKDNNGKISKVYLAFPADNRQGLGQEDSSYLGGGSSDGLYLTATKIKSETTGSNAQPATITVKGNINNQPFTSEKTITRYLYTEDPAGNANYEHVGHANDNGAPGRIRFVWKPQTFKYTATANSQIQTLSHRDEPSAEASINKTGLPAGTTYAWKTKPDTSSHGNKSGVVEVTYPDTSKDTVNVTVSVRKLSDEYEPTVNKIVKNQNVPVTNNDLKASVNISNNGKIKVKSVTPVGAISTTNAGTSTIKATVTYLDNTTDPVDIPLEVKDVIAPTIQTPSDRQNWDLIALDRTLPSITVTSVDNNGGTGVKSTTVTGLPDFLVYDNATKTIKFKNGVQEVTKLPAGQDSKTYTATIQVTDIANNPSQIQFTITVKSMTTKYTATPNVQKQTVSYGATPDAGTSINKNGLPAGTTYTWATTPSTTTGPGEKAGVVTVTYPDGSKDTVNVTVNVRKLSDEYNVTGTEIVVNQGASVSNDDLKAKVTAVAVKGNANGTDKISTVVPKSTISTANYGDQIISATVTFKDGTVKDVTIPLKVKDVTKPTIQTPTDRQNWDLIALDRTLPSIKVTTTDNPGGSGVKSTTVTGLPNFLTYDEATKTIKFKNGVQEVTKLPVGTNEQSYNVTIQVTDNANNSNSIQVTITVKSMMTKFNPAPLPQTVDNGTVPDAEASVDKKNAPSGTTVRWKETPEVTTPGEHTGVAIVHYPDGSEEEVDVPITVKPQKDTYNPVGKPQTVDNGTVPDAEASVDKKNAPSGTTVRWKETPEVTTPGEHTGVAIVHYPDGSEEEVDVPITVKPQKDTYNPVGKPQTVDNGTVPDAEASVDKKNAPSGTTVRWKETPEVTTPGEHTGVAIVHYPDGSEEEVDVPITVKPQKDTYNPVGKPQTVDNGTVPDAEASVDKKNAPSGTTVRWKETPEVTTPGEHTGVAIVHYPDGSEEEVDVPITVKPQKDTYNPVGKPQTVDNGTVPDAEASVDKKNAPSGTTVRWKETPEVTTPGEHTGVAIVHYPDGSEEVDVPITVKPQKDTYNPVGKPQTVDNGTVPDAEASVDKKNAPSGTTVRWKETPEVTTPGEHTGVAIVHYPDGSEEEVDVPITVKPQKDTYNPVGKPQTVDNGTVPDAEASVDKKNAPSGTTVRWKETPEVTTPGEHTGVAIVHYPDGSEEEVDVPITVKPQKDTYNPVGKPQTVDNGTVPDAEASVDKKNAPSGTTVRWKETPEVTTPGEHTGVAIVHYPDGSEEEVDVPITVKPQKDTYNPVGKPQTVDNGTVPDAEASVDKKNAPSGTTVRWKETPEVTTPGEHTGVAIVHYPDGSEEEVDVPITVKPQKDTYNPVGKPQTVDNGTVPDAEASVDKKNAPSGTTVRWKETPEVTTPGEHTGVAIVHYPDGSEEEVDVPITVKPQKDTYNPVGKPQTVDNGTVPDAEASVDKKNAPSGTTVRWKETPEVTTPGEHTGVAIVHYPDGSEEEVDVPITVKPQKDTYNPVGKPQTVDNGTVPDAEASVDKKNAPSGTTVRWKETPEVTTPGEHTGVAIVHYPDGSEEEVDVPITVKPQKDTYNPVGKPQTVDNGTVPDAEASVDKKNAPSGTTVRWKETPEVTTPGEHTGVAIVHYPDGSEEEVDVPITVKPQKDTYNPVGKPQTVDNGTVPDAEASVDKKNAPSGTTVRWKETPEVTTPGEHTGVAIVHYPDGSEEEVDVPITVKPQKDTYNPVGKPQTVDNGTVPDAEASVDKKNAPSGTTVRWKETPEVTTPGEHTGVAIVHYPDGSEEEVDVPITVKPQKDTYNPVGKPQTVDNGTVPDAEASVDKKNAPSGTTVRWKETPEVTTPGEHTGVAIVHYPDGSEEEVDVPITVKPQKDTYNPVGKPQTVDNGTVPDAEASVDKKNAPSGTTVRWKETPEVTTPGEHTGVAIVHYPDGSEEEVDVPITVKPQKDTYNPVGKPQTVDNGTVPDAEASVDKKNAPSGTTVRWKETPEVTTPGEHTGVAIVHYPDGSEEEVDVPITVKPQKDTYNPVGKPQTVDNGTVPDAEASVDKKNAPSGTTVRWKETPEVTTPGEHTGVAIVHYPDGSEEEVDVPITVKPQKDTYNPVGKPQTVDNGTVPDAEASVDKKNAPSGTTVRWKETPEVTTPGEHTGVAIVHYPDGSEEEVDVPITVKPQKDTYNPVGKPQTVDNGTVPDAEASVDKKNAPSGTTVRWKETPEVTTPGEHTGVAIVHYPDGSEEEVDVPITVKPQKDTYNPVGKPQTVDNGTVPDAEASVDKKNAPSGTTVRWKETPEVTTPGEHTGVAIVHYPDGSEEEVDVPITVKPQKDTYNPVGKPQTVDNGTVPDAEASVDKKNAPSGTTVRWKETPEVTTPGEHTGVAIVHYPDGSEEEVDVPITVKPQKDTYNPVGKPQTVDNGTVPDAEASVDKKNAPSGTTVRWKETPEVTTPGEHTGVAIVHYPDGSEEEVDVPITVKPQKDTYNPVGKPQTVDNGTVPDAEASVDKKNAPSGTTVRWKETPEVTTPGEHTGVAIVHYPDGSEEEVDVPITVKPQKDTYNPVGKPQTVDNGTVPDAEASVDKKNAPSGTTVRWKETPEVTTPGEHTGVAIVHYPDGSEEEVDVPITVKPQKDTYNPVGKPQTVDNGTVPDAEASVDKKNAPSGTTVRWKETPEVTTPGEHTGVAIVHYPDGSEEEVDVPITVKPQKDTYNPVGKPQTVDNGTVPDAEASVDKKNAPSGTTVRWKETPEVTTPGEHTGVAIVHYPDGSEEEVDVPITVKPQKDTYNPVGKPQTVDNGTVPDAEASVDKKNAPSGTTVRWKETPEVTTPGEHTGVAIVHYPDGSEEEVDVPITVKPQKDTYNPVGKPQTVDNGTVPDAEASVDKKNAPSGTTVRWKETPEVTTPGEHTGVAIVHYPDGSEEEVDVPITVKPQKDTYNPVGKPQTVDNGTVPDAEASVDKKNAPSGTTVRWKETPEVTTPGEHTGVAIVHYPDGSEEEVDVPITVKPQKDTYNPVGKPQTVDNGTVPDAEASVDKKNAPSGTTVRWKETPEVTTPGEHTGVAIVHYPDGSEEEVDVPITVKPQKDTYNPVGKPQTVDNGTVPDAEASVDKKNAPSGTTVRWKETPEVTTPGEHTGVAIVHYPDGSEEEVDVPITVKPQKDTYNPVGKPQTVDNGTVPDAEASVDKKNAPSGTTVRWKETPEVTTPGEHTGVAIVHYPDGSEEEVDVPITVKPQKDTYNPVGKPQTVDNGTVPDAEASVDKKNAPSGTTVRWKETPEVTTPGEHTGVAIVHYPDGSEEEVDVPITVKPQKDTYNPVGKPQTVDNGTVPDAEASVDKKNAPSGTTVRWKETPEVTTPGEHTGVAIVHYPDGSEEEVDVPITVKPQKDTYNPVGKPQTVDNGTVPDAEASVDKKNAPSGTTVRWKETPEVTTPGEHTGVAIVHYPDGSEEEVDVPITVKPQKDTYNPVGKPQTVDNGTVPDAEASVDKKNAPSGTTVRWKETPEVTTPGEHTGVAIVHYPDGSEEEVDVPITVKPQKDTYNPVGKPQTVDNGTVPDAEASVDKKNAPSGTTVRWKETPEVTTPGEHTGVAIVHYPDGSEEEVDVPITVKPQKDTYNPVGKPQTVDNGTVPDAEASVDKKNAPSGTTVRWKETPEVTTPGEHTGVAIVHYPDGSEEEVDVPITVKPQKDTYNPVGKPQTVDNGTVPDAEASVDKKNAPSGTTVRWKETPEVTTPGEHTGVAIVHYPDGSEEEVDVPITVKPQKDTYNPVGKPQTVDNGTVPDAEASVDKKNAPSGTTVRWKETPEVTTPGEHTGVAIVHYPDGSEEEVDVPITVKPQKDTYNPVGKPQTVDNGTVPDAEASVDKKNAPSGTTVRWKETPEVTTPGEHTGVAIVHYPDGSEEEVDVPITVKPQKDTYNPVGKPQTVDNGTVPDAEASVDKKNAPSGTTVRWKETPEVTTPGEHTGVAIVHYPDGSEEEVDVPITVKPQKDTYNPVGKPQTVDNGTVPDAEASVDKKNAPSGTTVRWKETPEVTTPGEHTGVAIVHYPDGSEEEVDVPITVKPQKDTYNPVGKPQTVDNGTVPDAEASVDKKNAPSGTTVRWKETPEVTTPGEHTGVAIVHYPDGSEEEVDVPITVKPQKDTYNPVGKPQTVDNGTVPDAEASVDKKNAPSGTTVRWKETPEVTTPGEHTGVAIVHYPDGSEEEVDVPITVKPQKDTYNPVGKPQTVDNGTVPDAEASVDKKNAPSGTTVRWKETPEVTTPGEHTGVAIVHYPDGSEEEVDVPITVKPQKDTYNPVGKPQTVDNGTVPDAEASVDKKNAPSGTTVRWKETPEVTTPGEHTGVAIVHYPDGSEEEVDVPITVKPQKDTYNPVGKPQTVDNGTVPDAEASVDKKNAPSGTTVRWKETPEVTTPGEHTGVAIVHYPDGSEEEVDVPITVKPQKDTYNPVGKPQTVDNGTVPDAEASVDKKNAPSGTTVRWKETPEVTTPGEHTGVAIVHYPDGSEEEVDVPITVKPQKDTYNPVGKPQTVDNGTVPDAEASVDKKNAPSGTTVRWKETPEVTTPGEHTGVAIVHYPDGSEEEVDVPITVKPQKDTYNPVGKPQTVDNGTVPDAEASVDKKNAPSGTTVRWKETPEVTTPGEHTGVAIVHYPDGSEEEVDVPITVKPQKDTYNPVGKPQTVDNGTVPDAEASVDKKNAPSGTTVRWKETPEVTTPGEHTGVAIVHYPDGSEEEVDVPITVKPQKDTYNPVGKPQTVDNGTVPDAEASVDKKNAPSGTTVRWKETPEVTTPGEHTGVAIVHYPDGSEEEVDVPITVKPQKDTYNPVGKPQTVDNGTVPDAEASVDKKNAPSGTTVRWKETPEVTTPGEHTGVAIVHYPDGSEEEVDVPITVKPQKDTYNPVGKPQTVDNGTVPDAEASVDKKNAPSGTTVRWKETPEVTTPGEHTGVAIVHYPDGSEEEVDVPITVKPQKDTYNPVGKPQTVDNGTVPDAEASVDKKNAPSGTTVRWKETPEVTTPGEHTGVAIVHYPDGSEEEVDVPITVKPQKDTYNPVGKPQTVDNGTVPDAEASVDKKNAPSGTTVRWKETPEVTTPGEHTGVAIVHYPDGSEEEVDVPITVKPQKDTYNPVGKPQTVDNGTVPDAEASVDKKNAPSGTTVRWKETPEVTTPGEHTGVAIVHYPDGSEEEVDVPITVKPQKDTYNPVGKPQTVDNGTVPDAEASVDKKNAPSGTTVRWKETPEVTTPGEHTGVAIVHYPDGSEEEVDVPITVKPQKDTYNPVGKPQTVDNGTVPDAEASVDKKNAPSGTTVRWKETPEVTTPGEHTGVAIVHYPDGSEEEVDVPITVKPQKDTYNPVGKPQTVDNGTVPDAEASVDKKNAPSGTTVRWKETPEVTTPGEHTGVAIVHYPDGSEEEVDVPIVVRHSNEKGIPEVQQALPEFNGGANGDPEVHRALPEFNGGVNGDPEIHRALPEFAGGVNGDPEVHRALPEFAGGANGEPDVQSVLPEFNGGVNGEPDVQPALPGFNGGVNGEPEVQSVLPEFNGGVNGEPDVQPDLPGFNGGVNGEPEVQPALPEFAGGVNGESEVQPALPEFNGGVNGEPEIQSELPKYLGRVNNDSEIRSNFRDRTSNVVTKLLANTGQSQNNSELAGLGLAIVGLFAAIKRRKNEEE